MEPVTRTPRRSGLLRRLEPARPGPAHAAYWPPCAWPRPSPRPCARVSVAKDAASVGCQDGGGLRGVAAAPSARAGQGRRRSRHSHHRHCTGAGTGAANPSAPVTRGLRDGVEGGAKDAGAAMREAALR